MVIFRIGKVRDKKERVAKLEESKMFTNCSAFFVIHNGLKLDLVIPDYIFEIAGSSGIQTHNHRRKTYTDWNAKGQ